MRHPQKIVVQHHSREDNIVYCVEDIWRNEVTNAPLNNRGWVFQERALAPRVVNFCSSQVFWECKEHEACESFPDGLPPTLRDGYKKRIAIGVASSSNQSFLETWSEIVEGYNRTKFTRADDKLVALSGLVKELKPVLGDEFIAGMWRENLLPQLLWRTGPSGFYRERARRPELQQGPSWSWASIDASVYNNATTFLKDVKPLAEILSLDITPRGEPSFGRVSAAALNIRGPLTRAKLMPTMSESALRATLPLWTHDEFRVRLASMNGPGNPTMAIVLLEADVYKVVPSSIFRQPKYPFAVAVGENFYLLQISLRNDDVMEGLILLPTGEKGEYRRVGAWVSYNDENRKKQLEHKPFLEPHEFLEQDDAGDATIRII